MKPTKTKVSITLDNDLLSSAKERAEEDDRSLSQYINIILRQHLMQGEGMEIEVQHVIPNETKK